MSILIRKKFLGMVLAGILAFGLQAADTQAAEQTVTKNGEYASVPVNAENFTGSARMESLFSPHEGSATYAAYVTFEPGARTHWHIHPKGQALIVTAGTGYVQEWGKEPVLIQPGDVVWCPAGVKHWHGATAKNAMTHLAISEKSDKVVTWLEPVSDEQYPQK